MLGQTSVTQFLPVPDVGCLFSSLQFASLLPFQSSLTIFPIPFLLPPATLLSSQCCAIRFSFDSALFSLSNFCSDYVTAWKHSGLEQIGILFCLWFCGPGIQGKVQLDRYLFFVWQQLLQTSVSWLGTAWHLSLSQSILSSLSHPAESLHVVVSG